MEEIVNLLLDKNSATIIENLRNIFLIIGSFIGIWLLWVRSNALKKQADISESGHNLDRFNNFLNVLESDNYNIRISAIQSLRLLMTEDTKYFWPIVKSFTSYVNHYLSSKRENNEEKDEINRTIVQEIIKALGDEEVNWLPHYKAKSVKSMDFLYNSFRGVFLTLIGQGKYKSYVEILNQSQKNKYTVVFRDADLKKMSFAGLFLSLTEFYGCSLERIYSSVTEMEYVKFHNCNLTQAKFLECNLHGSVFSKCNLTGATFKKSDISDVKFINCEMDNVVLSNAKNFEKAKISSGTDIMGKKSKKA